MHAISILAIIFGGAVLCLAIIGSIFIMSLKIIKGGVTPKSQKIMAEEAMIIQELHQGLSRIEERVESLESILLDIERNK